MTQGHVIEIFSADCPLCRHVTEVIELGKCKGCSQVVHDVNGMTEEIEEKMRDYDVKAVPTIVIDGEVKITGVPDFPWICDDELYKKLKKEYPLNPM